MQQIHFKPPPPGSSTRNVHQAELAITVILGNLQSILGLAGFTYPNGRGELVITATGRAWYPLQPYTEDVAIEDILHGLANTCRWGGQLRTFYSVAQHSCMVTELVARRHGAGKWLGAARAAVVMRRDISPVDDMGLEALLQRCAADIASDAPDLDTIRLLRTALLHDAPEAMDGLDISRPLKRSSAAAGLVAIQRLAWFAISSAFGLLEDDLPPAIRAADDEVLAWEWETLVSPWHECCPGELHHELAGRSPGSRKLDCDPLSPSAAFVQVSDYWHALELLEAHAHKVVPSLPCNCDLRNTGGLPVCPVHGPTPGKPVR